MKRYAFQWSVINKHNKQHIRNIIKDIKVTSFAIFTRKKYLNCCVVFIFCLNIFWKRFQNNICRLFDCFIHTGKYYRHRITYDEYEIMKNSQCLLESCTIRDPVERLRHLCLARGFSGILEFGRCLRDMEQNGGKTLNSDEFTKALLKVGFILPESIIETIVKRFTSKIGFSTTRLLASIRVSYRTNERCSINKSFF